jgi:hypothetical protein
MHAMHALSQLSYSPAGRVHYHKGPTNSSHIIVNRPPYVL